MAEDVIEDFDLNEESVDIPPKWKRWFKADQEHSSKWRQEAKEDFEFSSGKQWSDEDKKTLEEELRPAITFNRTEVIVDAVAGNEINNRQEVRYVPRENGDAITNEIYTEAARWFDDESEAGDEDSEAFRDAVVCGMGWTDTLLDFDDDPEGMPEVSREDAITMYWDNACTKHNVKDARRIWQIKSMDLEEAESMFPGVKKEDLDIGVWIDGQDIDEDEIHEDNPDNYYENGGDADMFSRSKSVRIIRMQHWVWQDFYKVADPTTGKVVELSEEQFNPINQKMEEIGIPLKFAKLRRKIYKQAFIGKKILSYGDGPCKTAFSWNCITGKYDRSTKTWYGLVRAMKDPQRWANKWMSQLLHIMNSNSKGGAFYEQGVFVDQRQAEKDWARPDALIGVKPGALINGRIKERGVGEFPQGYQILTEFAIRSIRDVTGVSLEMLGMREQNQPGVLEAQRKQAGMAVLAGMFNSLKRYRRRRGIVMLTFINDFLADGRLIRIVGQDKAQYVPLLKQSDVRYDTIVDDSPTSPNQKEQVWNSLVQILPGIKDMLPPQVMLQLLDYSPIPATVVEKIKAVVNAPNPEQEEQKRIVAQKAILDLNKVQADTGKVQADTAKIQKSIGVEAAVAETENDIAAADIRLKLAQTELAQAKAAAEIVGIIDEPAEQ